VELEVSAWTRRDRLERIAAAERDRRAGRTTLALAALGEGNEWPARLVLALAKLPEDEGAEAREILEGTLDDWAAESGLASLAPDASAPESEDVQAATSGGDEDELVVDALDALEEDLLVPTAPVAATHEIDADAAGVEVVGATAEPDSTDVPDALAAPIGFDELERAFAEAEAQTDEMHGVNDVAERVLMDEPVGLAELDGQAYDATEEVAVDADPVDARDAGDGVAVEAIETDAAWAEAPIWPEPIAPEPPRDASAQMGGTDDRKAPDVDAEAGPPTRAQVITTLERWLDNLQAGRAR